MSLTAQDSPVVWTAVDLVERLGAIPLESRGHQSFARFGDEHDVIEIHDLENRLYELLDGTLLRRRWGVSNRSGIVLGPSP